MSRATRYLDRKFYPTVLNNWDDELFRYRILESVTAGSVVLDLGAGAGIVESMNFRGIVDRVCGVDLDERVLSNSALDEAKVGSGERIPYDAASFDLVISDNVLEHLDDPEAVFREVARVLRPGGLFLFKTPNKWHYMPIIARLTPLAFHRFVNRIRGRREVDTFPTRYRANSRAQVADIASRSGLEVVHLETVESRPEYLRISAISYVFGIAYERIVNSSSLFAAFRILLMGVLRKPVAE